MPIEIFILFIICHPLALTYMYVDIRMNISEKIQRYIIKFFKRIHRYIISYLEKNYDFSSLKSLNPLVKRAFIVSFVMMLIGTVPKVILESKWFFILDFIGNVGIGIFSGSLVYSFTSHYESYSSMIVSYLNIKEQLIKLKDENSLEIASILDFNYSNPPLNPSHHFESLFDGGIGTKFIQKLYNYANISLKRDLNRLLKERELLNEVIAEVPSFDIITKNSILNLSKRIDAVIANYEDLDSFVRIVDDVKDIERWDIDKSYSWMKDNEDKCKNIEFISKNQTEFSEHFPIALYVSTCDDFLISIANYYLAKLEFKDSFYNLVLPHIASIENQSITEITPR